MALKDRLQNAAAKLLMKVDKNSPEILMALGLVGMGVTVYLVAKEAPLAKEKIEDLHSDLAENDEELSKPQVIVEEAKVVLPVYAPAIILGFTSAGCILGSHNIASRRAAAIATAYQLSETALLEYKKKVKEVVGDKKEIEIVDKIAQDRVSEACKNENKTKTIEKTGNGDDLVYDIVTGQWFYSSAEAIRQAENRFNKKLLDEMYMSLNEWLYELGLGSTGVGNELGMSVDDGLLDIKYSSVLTEDDHPALAINYHVSPRFSHI